MLIEGGMGGRSKLATCGQVVAMAWRRKGLAARRRGKGGGRRSGGGTGDVVTCGSRRHERGREARVVWPEVDADAPRQFIGDGVIQGIAFGGSGDGGVRVRDRPLTEEYEFDREVPDYNHYRFLNATMFLPFQELQSLSLVDLGIQGCIPGAGFEVWSNLHKLEILDLSWNQLNDTTILSLDTLPSLRSLSLSANLIIDAQIIKRLSKKRLKVLDLSSNVIVDNLPREVCNMTSLQTLDLHGNLFFGELPSCMGDLNSLQVLDLSHNLLKVRFPSLNFVNMPSLAYLSLSHNQLEGMLSLSSFSKCIRLKYLGLSSKSTNFQVRAETPVANMSMQLQVLELSNCRLNINSGVLHSLLLHQHGLLSVDLSNNNLSGHFPTWLIENNRYLSYLSVQNNSLVGPLVLPSKVNNYLVWLDASYNMLNNNIPVDISTKLPNLNQLSLSRNSFGGRCPSSFGYMENLQSLDISYNNISDDIAACFVRPQPRLTALFLSNNSFHGPLPEFLNFTSMEYLVLNNNNISGEIPTSICSISLLAFVDVSNNRFSGSLPNCISQISNLHSLNLRGNYFSGSIPADLCHLQFLTFLDLSKNRLSGQIPSLPNLTYLHLSENNFNGTFPLPLSSNSNLRTIDLRYNQLGGEIPSIIAEAFPELRVLLLKGNLFEGMISKQICHLKYLRLLDLSNNMLSEGIPSCLSSMGLIGGLNSFQFQYNSLNTSDIFIPGGIASEVFNGTLSELDQEEFTTKSRQDYYKGNILNYMSGLDFSSNQLQGSIPESIGNMQWLRALNFSNNSFSGPIPKSLSNLSNLESLDLSHNKLSGRIPPELTALQFLEVFSVAYNNLSGPTLGTKGQFITFDQRSYEGNLGLCGRPLLKNCSITPSVPLPEVDEGHDRTGDLILFGSSALFYAIGFWTSLTVLYFKTSWRWALFSAVDRFTDLLMVRMAILMRRFHSTD
ncbi:LRR receptor-like serine/threonine-protein kinase GSO1 [Dichanthelium oligosanthes]|uniref:LRR receptor-like serine/threonine-protein kinase GSO1 n=1 Tax=Dichanthelium oligosanthes TaxID=888268 RepID=A0A1E5WHD7_9POAL|nr:LRR receptor-like serine/threonine-protein kinase GSO1 [Dichanthelium oligosanthes]